MRRLALILCSMGIHLWGKFTEVSTVGLYDPQCCDMRHGTQTTYRKECGTCGLGKFKNVRSE